MRTCLFSMNRLPWSKVYHRLQSTGSILCVPTGGRFPRVLFYIKRYPGLTKLSQQVHSQCLRLGYPYYIEFQFKGRPWGPKQNIHCRCEEQLGTCNHQSYIILINHIPLSRHRFFITYGLYFSFFFLFQCKVFNHFLVTIDERIV